MYDACYWAAPDTYKIPSKPIGQAFKFADRSYVEDYNQHMEGVTADQYRSATAFHSALPLALRLF